MADGPDEKNPPHHILYNVLGEEWVVRAGARQVDIDLPEDLSFLGCAILFDLGEIDRNTVMILKALSYQYIMAAIAF